MLAREAIVRGGEEEPAVGRTEVPETYHRDHQDLRVEDDIGSGIDVRA